MDYVYVSVISLIVGFVGGHFFSSQLHAAVGSLESTIETRLKALEAAVLKKL